MKKRKIVIATHGNLAEGFLSALRIIVGDSADIRAICCYMSADFSLEKTIRELMEDFDSEKEDLLVFTDLFGGSVNNGFLQFLKSYPFHLITNTSLGLLIDVLLSEPDEEELKRKLHSNDFSAIYCNELLRQMAGNMEDDF